MPDDLIVRLEEWPGGLRCGRCHRKMRDGERYAESLTSMAGSIPVVTIVCCPCAEGQHTIVTG
jgi:acetyl-CoA carboxylase carboxyltransferase component